MTRRILKLFSALIIFSIVIFYFSYSNLEKRKQTVKICIDPGHGGRPEYGDRDSGDKWSREKKRYLSFYNYGGVSDEITEHEYVLELAELMEKEILKLNTEEGKKIAEDFLKKHGITIKKFKEYDILLKTYLTRKDSAKEGDESPDVNCFYRNFDSPVDPAGGDYSIQKGRLSRINDFSPHLTISLHLNFVRAQSFSGMHALFAPSYQEFSYIHSNRDDKDKIENMDIVKYWNFPHKRYENGNWMINDASTYFTGKRLDGTDIGKRNTMITWSYSDDYEVAQKPSGFSGNFWDRERSVYEKYRRKGGPEGMGGDNLFFSSELLRWVSYLMRKEDSKEVEIRDPSASDWSICLYNNSITAGLELGNIYSNRDRKFLLEKKRELAKYLAYGIYAVLHGADLRDVDYKYVPSGKRLDLFKYGDYFERAGVKDGR